MIVAIEQSNIIDIFDTFKANKRKYYLETLYKKIKSKDSKNKMILR